MADFYDSEAKFQVGQVGIGVGLFLITIGVTVPSLPFWMLFWTGFLLIVLGLVLLHHAGTQQRAEARAKDFIEWKREEQNFRRSVGRIWRRLDGAFPRFRSGTGLRWSFSELVERAGWPDARGETADELEAYLSECLPPPGHTHMLGGWDASIFRQKLGGRDTLRRDFEAVKDILEIWAVALQSGGSRESALHEVLEGLKPKHEDSLRLLSFMARTHTAHLDLGLTPDYTFLAKIRVAIG